MKIQIHECLDSDCRFRFPQPVDANLIDYCPLCKGPAQKVLEYQTDPELKTGQQSSQQGSQQSTNNRVDNQAGSEEFFDCHVLLDNLRSVSNVGSIFRTGDGVGVRHFHLCGTTPTPDHPRFAKTALGAERAVPWQYHRNGLQAVEQLKADGRYVIGLESCGDSTSIYGEPYFRKTDGVDSLLVIAGNEVAGIDPGILGLCDAVVHVPMVGIKVSLNVSVAFGIGIYQIKYGHRNTERQ